MKFLYLIALLSLVSCKVTSEQRFKDMSEETCECINLFTNDLSDGMIRVIEESGGDEKKLEEGMMEHLQENPTEGKKDLEILQSEEAMTKMTSCLDKLDDKYENSEDDLTEEDITVKMIQQLETIEGCKSAIVILQLGLYSK